MEEVVFRGYLFGLAEWGLRKRVPQIRWIAGVTHRGGLRALPPCEGRHHGSADRRHFRHGRRLRLAEDQVEFDDLPIPRALGVQRRHLRGSGAARMK